MVTAAGHRPVRRAFSPRWCPNGGLVRAKATDKFFVDGEKFPSSSAPVRAYFGYAWAAAMPSSARTMGNP